MRGQWLVIFLLIVVAVGCYWLARWLLDPMRALQQFLDAVARKDIDCIYTMVLQEEKEAGLTKDQVAKALDVLLYRHGQVQGTVILADWRANRWFIADVHWWKMEGEQRKPLPKARRRGPTVVVRLHFFRPPMRWRWQVSFTRFVWFQLYVNHSPISSWVKQNPQLRKQPGKLEEMAKEWAREQMRQWGIKEVFRFPVMTMTKGRYVVIWGKWEEEL